MIKKKPAKKTTTKKLPYVVVRTYSAGVHVGELKSRKGKEVVLINARRLWKWCGAFTLSELKTQQRELDQALATLTEQVEAHDHALAVPTGTAVAPR